MIKAKATLKDGRPLIVLGLSKMNLKKLKEGYPIKFNLNEIDLEGEVLIFCGKTEQHILRDFEKAGIKIENFKDFTKLH